MVYQLESGDALSQWRYEALIARLDAGDFDPIDRVRKLRCLVDRRSTRVTAAEEAIITILAAEGSTAITRLKSALSCDFGKQTIRLALRRLKATGLICRCYGTNRYQLLGEQSEQPLEPGAQIVFMPGLRSQKEGTIVEMRELKTRAGELHPVAILDNGQKLFVSPDTAKVNVSAITEADHRSWVLEVLRLAGPEGISHNDLAAAAFYAQVPQISTLIKSLVKSGAVRRVSRPFSGSIYSVNA